MPETHNQTVQAAGDFVKGLVEASRSHSNGGMAFDSAAALEFTESAKHRGAVKVPEEFQVVLDEAGDHAEIVVNAVIRGHNAYADKHGFAPAADLCAHALRGAFMGSDEARKRFALDSATSDHHDQWSLHPNRPVISILTAFSEGIPFANYLPYDIGSNEARQVIVSHLAGSTTGEYTTGALLDGSGGGRAYLSSARTHALTLGGSDWTGKITKVQSGADSCDQGADSGLLRGRTIVYVNGLPAAFEVSSTGTGASAISGSVTLGSTTYTISGTVNLSTGLVTATPDQAFPVGTSVVARGFLDFEANESYIPKLAVSAEVFKYFAKRFSWYTEATPDAISQMRNELGLDPLSESVTAGNLQYAAERHYEVLRMARRIAVNNTGTFDVDWSNQGLQKVRSDIWRDFGAVVGDVSQQMALDTMLYGLRFLYVGKLGAAQFRTMDNSIFQPSGIQERPGIFRLGRFLGTYDVYYCPDTTVVNETANSFEILGIGLAPDVARNPFVLSDAVPMTPLQLGVGVGGKTGSTFYVRNLTEVNRHLPSAKGCALINVTNLF
jgi:hypothetical protein